MLKELLPLQVFKKYANALVDAHAKGSEATLPKLLDRPMTAAQSARVKALRAVAAEQAQTLDIAPELLARRKDVENCLRHYFGLGICRLFIWVGVTPLLATHSATFCLASLK